MTSKEKKLEQAKQCLQFYRALSTDAQLQHMDEILPAFKRVWDANLPEEEFGNLTCRIVFTARMLHYVGNHPHLQRIEPVSKEQEAVSRDLWKVDRLFTSICEGAAAKKRREIDVVIVLENLENISRIVKGWSE